jgi:hypothetical protein
MSELFETYEREFCDLSGAITCDLNDLQTLGIFFRLRCQRTP